MHLDQVLCDGKAETGALVDARIAVVSLLEGQKDALFHVVADTDAVVDDVYEHKVLLHKGGLDSDAASVRGELHRIGKQVEQDLMDFLLIPISRVSIQLVRDDDFESLPPLVCKRTNQIDGVPDRLDNAYPRELELVNACVELYELEDVIDEVEEMPPALNDDFCVPRLRRVQIARYILLEKRGEPDD